MKRFHFKFEKNKWEVSRPVKKYVIIFPVPDVYVHACKTCRMKQLKC